MELTTEQIGLLKALAGLVVTGSLFTVLFVSVKLAVEKMPTSFFDKFL
jgi:hypothetical protein